MPGGTAEDSSAQIYTLPEVAQISGIDYRTLHNWQRRGVLRASRQAANGSGTVSLLDETDALQVLILAELRRSGIEMRVIEAVADRVWELAGTIGDRELLVISHGTVSLASNAEVGERVASDSPSVVLRVGSFRSDLDQLARAA